MKKKIVIIIYLFLIAAACPACLRQYDEEAKIVFHRWIDATNMEEIFIVDADGKNERRLTYSTERMVYPSWSPDGTCFVYCSMSYDIFVMDADGVNNRIITTGTTPSWSPDGKRLVYCKSDSNIYTAKAGDGSNEIQLTSSNADSYPSWSPDGKKIAFVRDAGTYQIFTISAVDGSGLTLISSTAGIADDSSPTWSPDGTKILFGIGSNLYTINSDGTNEQLVISNAYYASWSPDGSGIVFIRDVGVTDYQVFIADTDGGNARQLTFIGGSDSNPAWQCKPR